MRPASTTAFEEALDRYGSQVQEWPQDLRPGAEELLESSPAARALLAEAVQLDVALDVAFAAPAVPAGLGARIAARAERRDLWLEWLIAFLMRPWHPVLAACLPLLLGFAFGLGGAEDTADLEASVLVALTDSSGTASEAFEWIDQP